jgi:hypothetical protein
MLSRRVSLDAYDQVVYSQLLRGGTSGDSSLRAPTEGIKPTEFIANQKAESNPENGALTGKNTGLGRPPDPHQLNDPEDENRDGLRNVGLHKMEPPYPADSPKELHHKHQDDGS